jgi:hypothetical protein
MSPRHDIDYDALIDRAIEHFEPVKRLWSLSTRLFFWILFEIALLTGTGAFLAYYHVLVRIDVVVLMLSLGFPILASIAAAFLALRGAIPGREVNWSELGLLAALVTSAIVMGSAFSGDAASLAEGGLPRQS